MTAACDLACAAELLQRARGYIAAHLPMQAVYEIDSLIRAVRNAAAEAATIRL